MSHRYVYAAKAAAVDPVKYPAKKWGLFQADKELTEEEAASIYAADSSRTHDWFGIVRLEDGSNRPSAYLQMCPGANGVKLHRLRPSGSIEAIYSWGRWSEEEQQPQAGPPRLFLGGIRWYAYPDDSQFWAQNQAVGQVAMQFRQDGWAREDVVTPGMGADPDQVSTTESTGVDVSSNWTEVPEFGDWERFFHPEG